ncbi:MAG: S9 family peptidase [Bacteroidales bacterium]|jgi:oligopeptidase B|nr:S9 family peptidase [Bacteroidales bacterium]
MTVMLKTKPLIIALIAISFAFSACNNLENMKLKPPVAEVIPHEMTIHEHTRVDNYYWLNQREDSAVIQYLTDENKYTDAILNHTDEFQTKLYDEILGRIKQDDNSVPYFKNKYWYYTRYEEGQEYPIYCRKFHSLDADEQIMLNVNTLAEKYAYYAASGLSVSDDNKILSFGEDTVSRRKYTIRFLNLETGEFLADQIGNTTGRAVWAADNKTVFFSTKDESLRSAKIIKYRLGDENKTSEIFHEEDPTFNTYIYRTKTDKFLVIGSSSTVSNEYRILEANKPDSEFRLFQKRERDLEFNISHFNNKFYVLTNMDAKNFRLMETSESKTSKENWKEVIAHRDDVMLLGIELFNNFMAVEEKENGLTNIRIIDNNTKEEHYLDFGEETYTAGISYNPDFATNDLRYSYSSLTTPSSTIDYNMKTKVKDVKKQQEVLGDFSSENYEAKRIWATAKDGTKVPVSLVYKKDIDPAANNPLLLYAYGSYGYSMDPYFSSARLSLLDRGFVYAIAHIRGGQEMGRYWYEEGKMLNKMNTFTDFNACAEYLIAENYTSSEHLFAMGGSAGGLLMGAIINLQPELYKGVIAAVPFVDVVTTMLDESIPLTTGEFDEWGNPKVKEYYDYMLSYSPYDQVEAKNYPNLLVTTGLHDSQVQYWEPAKWVAKLRAMKTDDNILLLKTNMAFGHGGASGRFERLKEVALEYAFIFDLVGITE